jgi:hypothetical protein
MGTPLPPTMKENDPKYDSLRGTLKSSLYQTALLLQLWKIPVKGTFFTLTVNGRRSERYFVTAVRVSPL